MAFVFLNRYLDLSEVCLVFGLFFVIILDIIFVETLRNLPSTRSSLFKQGNIVGTDILS